MNRRLSLPVRARAAAEETGIDPSYANGRLKVEERWKGRELTHDEMVASLKKSPRYVNRRNRK